jgi:hypothetical protein
MVSCLDFEIGLTVATRINLRFRGIPDPDRWNFHPYSVTKVSLDGRSKGYGFPTAQWEWDFLNQRVLNIFFDFFDSFLDASAPVHIQTYRDVGGGTTEMIGTYDAIMHRPVDGEGKTIVTESRTPIYSGIIINFTHLVSE